jgi:ribosomal protein S18 acetylase RimI-like enzyme
MSAARAEILAEYDAKVRRSPREVGVVFEARPHVTRMIGRSAAPYDNGIVWSALDEQTVDGAIDEAVTFFEERGVAFEWKLFAHDTPGDLGARLLRRGFVAEVPETIMVIEPPAALHAPVAPGVRIVRVESAASLEGVAALEDALYDDTMASSLASELVAASDELSIYVAYAGDAPVAAGWTRFQDGNPFASLWGGATLPAHRRRGIYRALVAARVSEARARGFRYATVDARETRRPILERLGFARLAPVVGYVWTPRLPAALLREPSPSSR